MSYIGDMRSIAYTMAARRALMKMPADIRDRIAAGLSRLAEDGTGDVRKLSGEPGIRLRVGDYRVIFTESADTIEVRAVGHRREIYR